MNKEAPFSQQDSFGKKPTYPRSENPLIYALRANPDRLASFTDTINSFLGTYNETISVPCLSKAKIGNSQHDLIRISIPYTENNPPKVQSLKNVLMNLYSNAAFLREGTFFYLPVELSRNYQHLRHRFTSPTPCYFVVPSLYGSSILENPFQDAGVFFVGEQEKPVVGTLAVNKAKYHGDIPSRGTVEIHQYTDSLLSEVELAYLAIMTSLIMAGKFDLSTQEQMEATLNTRRRIFIGVYQKMLAELMPHALEQEIVGLDTQRKNIAQNLYTPLATGKGRPMNTLLIGAPGVGKSMIARLFSFYPDVLTVKIPVDMLYKQTPGNKDIFQGRILPDLERVKRIFQLPVVIFMDDVEALFESSLNNGDMKGMVDPEKRAYALDLLERLTDTYGIYIMATLNHPDIEAAFARRFNLVYFPLPDLEQRTLFLQQMIDSNQFPDKGSHHIFITELAQASSGLNYSGLALILDYTQNILLSNQTVDYQTAIRMALKMARSSSKTDSLKIFDQVAQEMCGLHHPLGFQTPGID